MPLHLEDLEVLSQAQGLRSALIVPCNMCPAVTVAVDRDQPFMELHRSLITSAPFHRHIEALRSRLRGIGVRADVFESKLYNQWFMCMWTKSRRRKLSERAKGYEAVIVLGCDTANETVREAVSQSGCRVIEGMRVAGYMNAKLRLRFPASIVFDDCRIVPIGGHGDDAARAESSPAATV